MQFYVQWVYCPVPEKKCWQVAIVLNIKHAILYYSTAILFVYTIECKLYGIPKMMFAITV
jgi:hypothetical protein